MRQLAHLPPNPKPPSLESRDLEVAAKLAGLPKGANQYDAKVDAQFCASTTQAEAAEMLKVGARSWRQGWRTSSAAETGARSKPMGQLAH
jgi:hypothetical protein